MSMNYQRSYSYYSNRSFGQRLLAAIALLLFISLFFYLSWQIYKLLFIISPIFIVIALVLHSPVVGNHIKSIAMRTTSSAPPAPPSCLRPSSHQGGHTRSLEKFKIKWLEVQILKKAIRNMKKFQMMIDLI